MSGQGASDEHVSGLPGSFRRWALLAVLLMLTTAGLAAAATPGRLASGDLGTWLAIGLLGLGLVAVVWASVALVLRHDPATTSTGLRRPDFSGWPLAMLAAVAIAGLLWAVVHLLPAERAQPQPPPRPRVRHILSGGKPLPPRGNGGPGIDIVPWLVVLLAVAVIAVVGWVVVHQLRSRRTVEAATRVDGDPLSAAIEAALLDLDGEQDPRRGVIKAYARAEAVLRAHGLPRRPAETPLEFLDRVLRELGAQAEAVDSLIELYERAAFSQHAIGPEMLDEAVAAFRGLRDGLLAAPGPGAAT